MFTQENQKKVKEGEQGKRRDKRFESRRTPQLTSWEITPANLSRGM